MWILRTADGEGPELVFRIPTGEHKTLGRATGAHFIVDAALVSRVHCRFSALPDGSLDVTDLGSTNGTFVNDVRVESARLAPGDRLTIGRMTLVVSADA